MPHSLSARALSAAITVLTVVTLAAPAGATPSAPSFGPVIDEVAGWDSQSKCDPKAKPGVLAFQAMVLRAYPGTGAGSISRACSVGGQSEHKEGRAWDWSVNVAVPSQKSAADELIKWLGADDEYGNDSAMARRLGIMYVIWNRRMWHPGSGWSVYCVQKKAGCKDPDDGGLRHPHTDHVHFSFTWDGARKETSFWHPNASKLADVAASPNGYGFLLAGKAGAIIGVDGAPNLGDRSDEKVKGGLAAVAPSPTGWGYYLVSRKGKVWGYGDADPKGSVKKRTSIVDMAVNPSGRGYWLVSNNGKVFDFGRAKNFGGAKSQGQTIAGIANTPTGLGYWLVSDGGRVFAYGDAVDLGGTEMAEVVSIEATPTGLGYWIANAQGKVKAFGDATLAGRPKDSKKVLGLIPTSSGLGYTLIDVNGQTFSFGDAR